MRYRNLQKNLAKRGRHRMAQDAAWEGRKGRRDAAVTLV